MAQGQLSISAKDPPVRFADSFFLYNVAIFIEIRRDDALQYTVAHSHVSASVLALMQIELSHNVRKYAPPCQPNVCNQI